MKAFSRMLFASIFDLYQGNRLNHDQEQSVLCHDLRFLTRQKVYLLLSLNYNYMFWKCFLFHWWSDLKSNVLGGFCLHYVQDWTQVLFNQYFIFGRVIWHFIFILPHIWQNCMFFGVFLPTRTLCDAYHKEFESHWHSVLDISGLVSTGTLSTMWMIDTTLLEKTSIWMSRKCKPLREASVSVAQAIFGL